MKEELKIVTPCNFEHVRLIGAVINRICRESSMKDMDVCNSELAVVEACTNVVKHAHKDKLLEKLCVEIFIESDRIEFHVYDKGPGFDLNKKILHNEGHDLLSESSRGIFIIKSVMDEVYYDLSPGGNIMRMIKYRVAEDKSN
jgi:serine/threonine-protein kinase RsbW